MGDTKENSKSLVLIQDLLSEKTLWDVYVASRGIPFSKLNNAVGIGVGFLCGLQSLAVTHENAVDQLATLATLVFNTTISLLGFLLAGFTFFATVADKSLFCRMATEQHESGLNYLKYNLFTFMRVFIEFLILCVCSLVIVLFLSNGSGLRNLMTAAEKSSLLSAIQIKVFAVVAFGIISGTFVYVLMQLKSFIFNVYHVVMTSIAWEIHKGISPNDPPTAFSEDKRIEE